MTANFILTVIKKALPELTGCSVPAWTDQPAQECCSCCIQPFQKPDLYDIVSKEEVAGLEQSMQKIFADIITEVSSIACWVYVEKYVHHKSLQEMLAERKDVDKFIFAVDTLFEKFLETEQQQS